MHQFHLVYNCFTPTEMNRVIKATKHTCKHISYRFVHEFATLMGPYAHQISAAI